MDNSKQHTFKFAHLEKLSSEDLTVQILLLSLGEKIEMRDEILNHCEHTENNLSIVEVLNHFINEDLTN